MERYKKKFPEIHSLLSDVFNDYGLNIADAKKEIKGKTDIYYFDKNSTLKYKDIHKLVKRINRIPEVSYSQVNADEGIIRVHYK